MEAGKAMGQHGAEQVEVADAAAVMDHRLRRLSAILWVVAIIVCLLATNSPAGQDYNRRGINLLLIPAALLTVIVVWYVPWQRYHRNLFLLTTSAALLLMPLLVIWSGDWTSPFIPYYYFIIIFSALYYHRRPALLITLVATLALGAPLLLGSARPAPLDVLIWPLLINATTFLAVVLVARLMADELLRLYGETLERLRERQQAEAALQQANDELEQHVAARTASLRHSEAALVGLLGDLAARTQALEAKTCEQETFIYTVAHDLQSPLFSLQGMAQIILEDHAPSLPDDAQRYLARIITNTTKMQSLLHELLELARVGRVEVEDAPVDLNTVLAEVREQLSHSLTSRGAEVVIAEPLPIVQANPTRMNQLFSNLLANAIQYTPLERVPRVRITASPHAAGWEVCVADNGIGIPAAYHDRIFSLFQRLPTGKALNPQGTGAGLAIVARIVETYGGRLWLDSVEGVGTTFHLTLPRPTEALAANDGDPVCRAGEKDAAER